MDKEHNTFQMIADYEGDIHHLFEMAPQGDVPILTTRNMVLFPGVIAPILVGRPSSYHLIRKYQEKEEAIIGIFCQKDPTVDTPSGNDLYEYGVYAKIIRVLEMPGPSNNITAIVQGLGKCRLNSISKFRPFIIGKTEEEARRLSGIFMRMIKEKITDEEREELEEAGVLQDIAHMPARVKCAVLGWHTMEQMLSGATESVTTEGKHDPAKEA